MNVYKVTMAQVTMKSLLEYAKNIENMYPCYTAPYLNTSLASGVELEVNPLPGNVKKS